MSLDPAATYCRPAAHMAISALAQRRAAASATQPSGTEPRLAATGISSDHLREEGAAEGRDYDKPQPARRSPRRWLDLHGGQAVTRGAAKRVRSLADLRLPG